MKKELLFVIFSCCSLLLKAQTDTLSQSALLTEKDTIVSVKSKKWIEADVYVDYGKLLLYPSSFESKLAFGGNIIVRENIILNAEYGQAILTPSNAFINVSYTSTGSFMKLGAGYITKFKEINKIGLIGRAGKSSFNDKGQIFISDTTGLVSSYENAFERNNLSASWWELALISEKKLRLSKSNPEAIINRLFTLGFLFQVRFMIDYDTYNPVDVYSIPGYGRTFDKSIPAFNLFLKINLL